MFLESEFFRNLLDHGDDRGINGDGQEVPSNLRPRESKISGNVPSVPEFLGLAAKKLPGKVQGRLGYALGSLALQALIKKNEIGENRSGRISRLNPFFDDAAGQIPNMVARRFSRIHCLNVLQS